MRLVNSVRSVFVDEETDETLTIRSAAGGGLFASVGLAFLLWRTAWLPHRWYQYDGESADWDNPSRRGWRWRKHDFLVRSRRA